MVTERIRLGTLLTPASRHRPWDLASRVGSVDRISGGRAFMSVGLGALHPGWIAFEADEGRAARARKLDESLAIYAGLLGDAASFTYAGRYYSAGANDFMLPPPTRSGPTRRSGSSAHRARAVAGSAPSSGRPVGRV